MLVAFEECLAEARAVGVARAVVAVVAVVAGPIPAFADGIEPIAIAPVTQAGFVAVGESRAEREVRALVAAASARGRPGRRTARPAPAVGPAISPAVSGTVPLEAVAIPALETDAELEPIALAIAVVTAIARVA